ncbi:MAG: T9SS type A sorting domain-containing protein [Sphingobacteriales bacterium]|nr:MAG: T9SS type A sorting domain-containing protein [Sphingobacteriales bacterium]
MRIGNLLLAGALAFAGQVNAQNWVEDSVTMGPNYANDIYYSLKNGSQKVEPNGNWHLAFQTTPQGPYGNVSVFANHVQTAVNIYSLHMSATTSFTSLTAADTVGKTGGASALYNTDTSWNFGAFNRMADPGNLLDYSWGTYNMSSHNVEGDSLYLVTVGNALGAVAYKLWIQQYKSTPADSVQWKFRIAKLDGTEDTTIRIYRKPTYTDRMFAYYNVVNRTVLDREPGRFTWDLLFTRYKEYITGAPGIPYYNVTGVLSNFDVTVAQVTGVGPDDTTGYMGFNYNRSMKEIGSDWKSFNNTTFQYTIPDSNYYFVKTLNTNEYYQVQFTGFGGSADGKSVFRKRFLGSIVNSVSFVNNNVDAFYIAPNPASADANVMIDGRNIEGDARMVVADITGRIVMNTAVRLNNGLNAFRLNTASFPAGTYVITLGNASWKTSQKLVVQH